MPSLIAKSPCEGLLPIEIGPMRLSEVVPEAITWISAFDGQEKNVSAALKAAIGAPMPAPNRTTGKAGTRAIWCGPGQALVLGPPVEIEGAAVVDQSDGWAVIMVEGTGARDTLARLTPLDLRDGAFKHGHTARTLLNHMTASLTRVAADRFEVMVFRSMAQTAVHELQTAAERVAARG